ncbi:DNA polymerase eta subunit [Scheffersomyces coipomensis]|uniref:DNA polymerase eta subunit n=1 Tax=Scheffersomyces coipomensis TaxID=1788519 RepID=UPI00315C5BF9
MSTCRDLSEEPTLVTRIKGSESRFKVRDLLALNDPSKAYLSPLAVVGLIDLNAFFAQVEQIRLGLSVDDPIVCVQWQSLIAVSYAARKYGIHRMDSVKTAKEKCPNVILAHAAVFKHGESHWKYIPKVPYQAFYKVSLDPYRRESRKIIQLIQQHCDIVEKASVDEAYMDFGRLVFKEVMSLFPDILNSNDPNATLPPIPKELPSKLSYIGEVILTNEEEKKIRDEGALPQSPEPPALEVEVNDWDDILMMIGSRLLHDVRMSIYKEMGYTTSAGLGRNKLIAKVAAGFKKPDNQTIIRNSSINNFFRNFQLVDFTGMGGKIGESMVQRLGVPPDKNSTSYIRENFTLEAIEDEIREDLPLAKKVYEIVRGNHQQELTNKLETKSMMSRKNFLVNHPVTTLGAAYGWLRVYAGDLYNRMIELDDQNLNLSMSQVSERDKGIVSRPRTLMMHIETTSRSKFTKRCGISVFRSLEKCKEQLETISIKLLKELLEANTNIAALNNDKSLKTLEAASVNPENINIISISAMSITISNFMKTTDASLIDTYGGSKIDHSEDLKREFREISEELEFKKRMEEQEVKSTTREVSEVDKLYIKQLFKDFNSNEINQVEKHIANSINDSKRESESKKTETKKADPDYIKKLFQDFNAERHAFGTRDLDTTESLSKECSPFPKIDTSTSRKTKRPTNDIFSSLKKKKTEKGNDQEDLLKELIETMYCKSCNTEIVDAMEHNDFHVAMKLSSKINAP